ncbi:MAG: response regulator, partial [Dehalococcoidia bacterium]|nr:response regulator [Dehalococcoidia bacterium]
MAEETDLRPVVLVVEDDEGLLGLVGKRLERSGFRVVGALTGMEAAASAESSPPALMLLDYRLPDMTASDVVEAFAAGSRRVPFIITTGRGDERLAVEMMKLGARDYLVKDASFLDRLSPVVER